MPLKPEERRRKQQIDSLLGALQDIHEQLRSLVRLLNPFQEPPDTIPSDDTRHSEHDHIRPTATIHAVTHKTDAELRQQETDRQSNDIFQRKTLSLQRWMIFVTFLAFAAAAAYAWIAKGQKKTMDDTLKEVIKQTNAAIAAATTAQKALDLARDNFRQDQRPYIALGPAGFEGRVEIVKSGEYTGHLAVELHLANFGKSAGIEIGRDSRLAIGSAAGKQIRLHTPTDRRGRIIPPGDKPSIYAYSDGIVSQEVFNDIVGGKTILIAYGHVEYTDLLGEPRPVYTSEFCTGILVQRHATKEVDADCKDHTRLK